MLAVSYFAVRASWYELRWQGNCRNRSSRRRLIRRRKSL